jgi:hypothetical protein
MTQYLTPKKPSEVEAYFADWAKELGADTISSFTLTVAAGTITLSEELNVGVAVRFLASGGVADEVAEIDSEVVTVGGQTLTKTLSLTILADASPVIPQTTTKRTIVNMAFEEINLAGYEFDATPEEQFSALRRLDALMAQWKASSLDVGYNFPAVMGAGDLDDPAGIPDLALNPIVTSLAMRVMPTIGKTMSAETRVALAQGMVAIRTWCATIPDRQLQARTARGSGNKPYSVWNPFGGVGQGNQ